LNGTHKLLVCIDDVNLLGKKINIVEESTGTLLAATEEVGPDGNAKKTNSTFTSYEHNGGHNQI
jgi:hypothetical protein